MLTTDGNVIPSTTTTKKVLQKGDVGISFAIKTKLFHEFKFKFIPNQYEDYNLLQSIQLTSAFEIIFSDFITYEIG